MTRYRVSMFIIETEVTFLVNESGPESEGTRRTQETQMQVPTQLSNSANVVNIPYSSLSLSLQKEIRIHHYHKDQIM